MEEKKELSLYVHIPFCVKKCNYCDFLSFSSKEEEKERYVQALCNEIKQYQPLQNNYRIQTIFFGGGTPSLLKEEQMERIFSYIYKSFQVDQKAEITVEMNPNTITENKLKCYKQIGINRLSLGLQTTDNERLKLLGRIHTYEQFLEGYELARKLGFSNVNIDLMSALPTEKLYDYQLDLERIISLQPEHISSYSLIMEEGTPFYNNDKIFEQLPTEEEDRQMYEMTEQMLLEAGYERYEISNYARNGKECKHNIVYWTGREYLGLGLGASSYLYPNSPFLQKEKELGNDLYGIRFKNTPDFIEYNKKPYVSILNREEVETQGKKDTMEEFMFLGLRLTKGVDKNEFFQKFGVSIEEVYGKQIEKYVNLKLLQWEQNGRLHLTKQGLDVSNSIFSDFLFES